MACHKWSFVVRRIKYFKGNTWLIPENENYKPLKITENIEFEVWGIAIHVINSFQN